MQLFNDAIGEAYFGNKNFGVTGPFYNMGKYVEGWHDNGGTVFAKIVQVHAFMQRKELHFGMQFANEGGGKGFAFFDFRHREYFIDIAPAANNLQPT
jgi:hypothetical protein